jgi:hypothetical protein
MLYVRIKNKLLQRIVKISSAQNAYLVRWLIAR